VSVITGKGGTRIDLSMRESRVNSNLGGKQLGKATIQGDSLKALTSNLIRVHKKRRRPRIRRFRWDRRDVGFCTTERDYALVANANRRFVCRLVVGILTFFAGQQRPIFPGQPFQFVIKSKNFPVLSLSANYDEVSKAEVSLRKPIFHPFLLFWCVTVTIFRSKICQTSDPFNLVCSSNVGSKPH
jgi:hypothetical protein